ncbi:carboxy terminal-processing peptidase [Simiduia agarivorans]|uniref:Tail-specific protease periplasmic n=1 Tax=Simiduia agarivorans (strain DSM 21679 / JCM 13881 / BCRC 17597 / SA1) TaxID=1117647 RepID=K4KIM3_SIMAS|nr:carboxy terminal-processing peptidase [Simiduia agarivorans]AFU97818.2 tail-specific protease periplasmic [Simiduia agarivorans SA1 = DSM 21679]
MRYLALTLALVIACTGTLQASTNTKDPELRYTESQSRTAVEIIEKLSTRHYRKLSLDDNLSSAYLDKLLETLDPGKAYFYASDVNKFEKNRKKFDDFFKSGDLSIGYQIYGLYRDRVANRLDSIIAELEDPETKFDFTRDEALDNDRENAAWPKDKAEADELWRQRVKAAVLSLKLSGKTVAEAKTTLIRRYKNQANRLAQQDGEDVFETLINALTLLYDPHTNYLSPRTLENFNINMSLSLEGIGAVLQTEDEFTKIVRLVAAGPAEKSGQIKPSDKILAVGQGKDGEMVDVVGWRLDEVVQLIRGEPSTVVRLQIQPANEDATGVKIVSITRERVKLEEQAAKKAVFELKRGDETYRLGVIDVPAFYLDFEAYRQRDPNFKSTTRDVRRLLFELEQEKVDGIILDLRNNGGGSLQEATTLTDLFIDQGPVVQIRQSNETISRYHRSRERAMYRGPLLVLINRLSASASEIFAGAIQDYGRGIIVGSQSFGKGTVQSLTGLQEGQLKITESKFYRVSGDSTQHRGVIPDITLPNLIDDTEVGESAYDNALPWDKIHPVAHDRYFDISNFMAQINPAHEKRVVANPDFNFLADQMQLMNELKQKKTLSLNESQRLKEKAQLDARNLAAENMRRKAKGEEPYASIEALKEANDAENEQALSGPIQIDTEKDSLLLEAGEILADFIVTQREESANKIANFN